LVKAFVQLPGGATAIYNSSGIASYRHTDWLGTSRLTSTQARGLFSSSASAPFGEQYAVSGTADASFTGQNSDTVSSLYDFTFREHSPSQGRWISPDPLGPGAVDPGNPQSWNRYEYVSNNPLALIDPLGLDDSSPIFTFYSIVTLTEVDVFGTYSHLFDGSSFFSGALRKSPHARFQGELRGGSGAANCTPLTPGCSNVPTAQQQQTKDCMGDWSNSPLGKGVQFLSLNNLANNITSLKTWAEWTALPAGKMLTLTATNNLSQAIGNTEFLSVTGGTSTVVTAPTAAGIETTEAVGAELAPLAILGATVTDMRVQAHCEGFDVPMALRGPG
jgi:RHS repeat-associated protein